MSLTPSVPQEAFSQLFDSPISPIKNLQISTRNTNFKLDLYEYLKLQCYKGIYKHKIMPKIDKKVRKPPLIDTPVFLYSLIDKNTQKTLLLRTNL